MKKKTQKKIKNYFEFIFFKGFITFLKLFPFMWGRRFLGDLFSNIAFTFNIRRDLAFNEIKASFPDYTDNKINSIVKEMYRNLGKMLAEMYLIDAEQLFDEMSYEGLEYLQNAMDKGKGVIFASGHFGNWENAGQYISSQNIEISAVIKKMRNNLFDEYTRKIRTRLGVNVIYSKGVLKNIVSALRNNHMVALMIDQDAKKGGIILPFLGRDASMFTGPARFSLNLGSPIVFGIAIRNSDDSIKVVFDKPIYPEDYKDKKNAIEEITLKLNQRLEYYVKKYPAQWFWVHRRWKYASKLKKQKSNQI